MSADAIPDLISFRLDGKGGAERIPPARAAAFKADGRAFAWLHLRRELPEADTLLAAAKLEPVAVEALTADETRPRCTVIGDGVLLKMRGVNLNPGADPEDMVSVRLWLDRTRVVGVWLRPLMAVSDLVASIERGQAPRSPADLAAKLALRLADRAEPSIFGLNERIDDLEEAVLDPSGDTSPSELSAVRRRAILLRRYLVPQRDALMTLEIEELPWLETQARARLREAAERVYRLCEDLDAIRDRAQVIHDQIADRRAERMNHQMLVLSTVAAIFLPLGLLTGLLGINVGGIPGSATGWAFWAVCGLLLAVSALLVWVFYRLGLFR